MNGYEKLIKTMREESRRSIDSRDLKIAVMTSPATCTLGQLELDKDDLLVAEHLVLKKGDMVLITKVSAEKYAIIVKLVEVSDVSI